MAAETAVCPTITELRQFAVGDLTSEALERIGRHIERCGTCEGAVDGAAPSSDRFLKALAASNTLSTEALDETLQAAILTIHKLATGQQRVLVLPKTVGYREGTPPVHPMQLPRVLGQYELIEQLGRGGMGVVYKATHTRLNRHVAVKVLTQDRFGDADSAARFEQEMRIIGSLSHPNIVAATDLPRNQRCS